MRTKLTIVVAAGILLGTLAPAFAKAHRHSGQPSAEHQLPAGGAEYDYPHTFCCS